MLERKKKKKTPAEELKPSRGGSKKGGLGYKKGVGGVTVREKSTNTPLLLQKGSGEKWEEVLKRREPLKGKKKLRWSFRTGSKKEAWKKGKKEESGGEGNGG